MSRPVTMSTHEWNEEGERLFGPERKDWQFVCPQCGTVASIADYLSLQSPLRKVGRVCIGTLVPEIRALGDKATAPCNYAADRDAPVRINDDGECDFAFAFATPQEPI